MKLPIASDRTVAREIGKLIARNRKSLLVVVALQSLAAIAALLLPYLLGMLVDAVTAGTTMTFANILALALICAAGIEAVLRFFGDRRAFLTGETIFAHLREDLIERLTHLPLSTVENTGTGDLVARTTNDVTRIQNAVRFGIPTILIHLVTIAFTLTAAFVVNPLVALALFTGLPLLIPAAKWHFRDTLPAYTENAKAFANLNAALSETVANVRAVDALNLGPWRRSVLRKALQKTWGTEAWALRLRMRLFFMMNFAFHIPIAFVVGWGIFLSARGSATIGELTAIAMFALQLPGPVSELLFWSNVTQVSRVSFARILGVNEVAPDRTAGTQLPAGQAIIATDVHFSYVPGVEVLHGISLTIQPGEHLAIVGPSGAGKSTFGRMLAGIHPPSSGSVTLGGVNVVELPEAKLRENIALVTQEQHVFVGTIADNLRLVKPGASDDELWEILTNLGADSWVKALPDQLHTPVGSGARELSDAQAQQLALARLVLLNPHTLVLDEATSLLDPRAAREIERALAAVLAGRTVISIAHRLYTAHDADRVAVIDDGRIIELGTHAQLVAGGGAYAKLWESWQRQ